MVSLGRPLGSVVRPLLLQRTTVSRQEHSAGHLSTGEQLFSSLPGGRHDGMERGYTFADVAGLVKTELVKWESHHLHRQSPGQLHPEWGSLSRSKDSGSEGYR